MENVFENTLEGCFWKFLNWCAVAVVALTAVYVVYEAIQFLGLARLPVGR